MESIGKRDRGYRGKEEKEIKERFFS